MFDIKYDKDGMPIKSNNPVVENIPEEQPQSENSPVDQESSLLESTETVAEEEVISQPQAPQENTLERNARAMRELREKAEKERIRAEKERDEALRRAQELEEKYARPQQNTQKYESQDEDLSIGEDDLVEGKHVKKIQQYVKRLENKLNQYEQKSHQSTLQDRIRYDFPDFNKVVTQENIDLLRHLKPRQAQLLDSSTDLYATAASAYEMIKEYGIYQEPTVMRDREIAQKNISKPRPTNSISPQRSNSPLTQAHDFANGWTGQDSPEAKATYKQMLEAMKGR